ncbi:MAG: hypothetical protein U0169_12635 [Polyangiaceae bacterium]
MTALNTASAIVGSLWEGFVALPLLGSEGSLRALVVAYAAVAVALAVPSIRAGRPFAAGVLVSVAAVAWIAVPRWDRAHHERDQRLLREGGRRRGRPGDPRGRPRRRDDRQQDHGRHDALTNGKFQGDDGFQVAAQRGFAHVPALFVHEDRRALVIGLGTGMTLGTLATYPFERIDLAELSPGIVDAARRYFGRINRDVLADPRVHVLLEDGRNVLWSGTRSTTS